MARKARKKTPKAQLRSRVDDALALVQLEELADRRPNALSGGQQQRVALARALVVRPKVLLLDEPLSNLDARLRREMRSEIRRICKDASLTGLYVTHDQDEALSMADRIALLRDGQIVQCAPPAELYGRPETRFAAQFLGDTNLIKGTVMAESDGRLSVKTPFGILESTSWAGETPPSGDVTCSIRPEALVPSVVAGVNGIEATPGESVFLGERIRFSVRTGDGSVLDASLARPEASKLGTGKTTFTVKPCEVVVLRD